MKESNYFNYMSGKYLRSFYLNEAIKNYFYARLKT